MLGLVMSYVRCRYCDEALELDDLVAEALEKEDGCCHEQVVFECPACGFTSKSFVFTEEQEFGGVA